MKSRCTRIFVMDDEQAFLEEISEMLNLSGYEVGTSSDNERAVEKIREFDPQLLLLDLKMTPRSGFQIAHDMKHSPHWQRLVIIGMSGYFLEKEHLTLMNECGIKSFLAKPFNPLNLIAAIESEINQLSDKSSRREERLEKGSFANLLPMEAWNAVTT